MKNFNKRSGFSLAEVLISLLIVSVILAATLPVITVKTKTKTSPWFYASNNSDIYFGAGASNNQGVAIGLDTLTDHDATAAVAVSKLEIQGRQDVPQVIIRGNATQTNNIFEIKTSAGTDLFTIDNSGNVVITGSVSANGNGAIIANNSGLNYSDARLKDIISTYDKGLEDISKLKTYKYKYKEGNEIKLDSTKEHAGVIAQELQEVMPDAVAESDKGYLQIDKDKMFYAMINAIQELKKENDELKSEITAIKKQLDMPTETKKGFWQSISDWFKGLFK